MRVYGLYWPEMIMGYVCGRIFECLSQKFEKLSKKLSDNCNAQDLCQYYKEYQTEIKEWEKRVHYWINILCLRLFFQAWFGASVLMSSSIRNFSLVELVFMYVCILCDFAFIGAILYPAITLQSQFNTFKQNVKQKLIDTMPSQYESSLGNVVNEVIALTRLNQLTVECPYQITLFGITLSHMVIFRIIGALIIAKFLSVINARDAL
ncbi:hypothetical protein RFI_22257 [Reticulomyxa filosa]|uniref:Uncharacterized protein n=1 Tax=Reticulomyxa filosa TaxID=46433 RepID=X6MM57_RETFI|nr:hypothetical protein RFI_22257 [Reticulomyxa filosa]|eukprot:ETO15103.1 hypothetical protein RFI_22257 [Reticulomyxa filosa]